MATASDAANPLHDITAFKRDLLVAIDDLAGTDPSGLDTKAYLNEAYDRDPGDGINHGRLYPNLDDLADMGLVEKGAVDKRTNYYTLTARGERELAAHRAWVGVDE